MSGNDGLHLLIRSLTKSEKRYFRLYCSRQTGAANYLRLFKMIEKQEIYDEKSIKTTFRTEVFIRQLHVIKNYLRNLILASMRNYHAEISRDAILKDVLRNVEILYNKELYDLCRKELRRAENIAMQYELHTGAVEVMTWKRKLAQALAPHAYSEFRQILKEQRAVIRALQITNDTWHLAVQVTEGMYVQSGNVSVRNVSLKLPAGHSLEDTVLYRNTQYLLDLRSNRVDAAEKQLTELLTGLERFPHRIAEDPGLYVSSLNNLLSFLVFQKRFTEALTWIQKAKGTYDRLRLSASRKTLLKQILRTYNIELEIYRTSPAFTAQVRFIKNTEAFVYKHEHKIPRDYLISFWFQFASIYFIGKDYNASLEWISKILNTRFGQVRVDLQVQALLLNLMVHLEQKNLMVLRYFVDSAKRFIKKAGYYQEYIEVLLRFFAKMGRLPLLEYEQAYYELKRILYPEGQDALIPGDVIGYIDYRQWIDGKLRDRWK